MKNEFENIDCMILNPPYSRNLYKKFLITAYNMLSDKGKMMFICPAAFLDDQRSGLMEKNEALRKTIEKHVVKIIIDNYNPEFGTRNYHPFSVIYIDKNKRGRKIEFICNGEHKTVNSIDDCNINGNPKFQLSIQRKCMKYRLLTGERLIQKTQPKKMDKLKGKYFVAFNGMLSTVVSNANINKPAYNIHGLFYSYTECYVHHNYQHPMDYEEAKKLSQQKKNPVCWFYFGTKKELENWIYNSMNLKLMKAFSIIRFWDQNNQVKKCAPFLCDKKYTDEEAYKLFNINEEEQ